jgi:hypothetical protein
MDRTTDGDQCGAADGARDETVGRFGRDMGRRIGRGDADEDGHWLVGAGGECRDRGRGGGVRVKGNRERWSLGWVNHEQE